MELMTSIYGNGFIPISTLIEQCIGINVESVSMECMDNGLKIVGTLVPRSPRGYMKAYIHDKYANYLESKRSAGLYKKIIINPPATIVIWNDGTKTVVKATENDIYDPEKGVALCFFKKYFDALYRQVLKEANDIYEKKMDEDIKRNGFDSGICLKASPEIIADAMKEIGNQAHRLIFGDPEKKEDGGDK